MPPAQVAPRSGVCGPLVVIYVLFRIVPAPGVQAPEGVDGCGVLAMSAQVVAALAPT